MAIELKTAFGVLNEKAKGAVRSAQNNLLQVTNQVTTGKRADSYTGLLHSTPLEPLFNARDLKANYDYKIQGNTILLSKLSAMEKALRNINEKIIPDSILICMRAQDPSTSGAFDATSLTKNQLSSIKSALEATFNNEKLFAGSCTKAPQTIGDIVNNTNIVNGQITKNYYLGNDYIATEAIALNQHLQYGITANNDAFSQLIAAHNYILAGDFTNGMNCLQTAKAECANLISLLGSNSAAVSAQVTSDEQSSMHLTETIANMEDVDIMEALTDLYNLQSQVKASFILTTKLNELSLVNYIK